MLCPVTLNRLVAQGSIRYIASLEVMDSQGNISHICCHGESCVDNILLYTCEGENPCEGFDLTNIDVVNQTVESANCTNACDTILTFSGDFDFCVPSTATFSNTGTITIPGGGGTSGPADPYPSVINVAGLDGTITKVTATLNGFSHTFPLDVDVMLVAPDGTTNTLLMSDPDSGSGVTNLTLTFDDAAVNPVPCGGILTSGTYQPTDCAGFVDTFPAPAPVPNAVVALSNFNGLNPNGTWSLFVVDNAGIDAGSISNGWSITITTTC
ncbi:proprotein convertase P-domain-containing protein [Rossellomorea aquimaris]|uniref:proprotein convertase P-domain-containing protein n=1 Tax=Rossellomorea aquimaris TaxID=189382 RepID=UPI0012E071E0|nr:proprotein convertase P-domain-containing protein [Rossellomorea aquimaris]